MRVFGRHGELPPHLIHFLNKKFCEIGDSLKKNDIIFWKSSHSEVGCLIRWKATCDGWVVLNTDEASKGNLGPQVGGGIIRDTTRRLAEAFAERLGNCTAPKAELLALRRGLPLAQVMASLV